MPRYPTDRPFRVSDRMPACDRLAILNELALQGVDDPGVAAVAALARARAAEAGGGERARAAALLRVVQAAGFRADAPGEWFQAPRLTIARGGDCEDLTVLLKAASFRVPVEAKVMWIEQPGARYNHVAAMVRVGGDWLWADPSIAGARLGESPYEASRRLGDRRPFLF